MRTTTRTILASALTVPLVAGATAPAMAWTKSMSKDSGTMLSVQWTEYGTIANVEGNVHVGYLDAQFGQRDGFSFVSVTDYACDEGEVPGGGHGDEPSGEEGLCDVVSVRDFFGDSSSLTLTVDRKLNRAHLSGSYLSGGGHGDPGSTGPGPSVDLTVTGVGSTSTRSWTESYSSDGSRFSSSYTATERNGTVSGRIGAMGFDDDADDVATAGFGTFRSTTRETTR